MAGRESILQYLLDHVGVVVTKDELRMASGNQSEWARRLRELRDEHGYQIVSHKDNASLKPGQYILLSTAPGPTAIRNISNETRARVLERDGYTCQTCGAEAGQEHPETPGKKTQLQIGHVIDKSKGGSDDAANLRTQCSLCNQGLQNLTPMRPDLTHVLVTVRKATREDQRAVLEWLKRKFGEMV